MTFATSLTTLLSHIWPWALLLAITATMCLGAVRDPSGIAAVDTERILRESRAAQAGMAHLDAVMSELQKGWEELQKAAENEPEEQRRRALAQGMRTMQQQLQAEESAVRRMILKALAAEAKTYRQRHTGIAAVIPKEALPDGTPHTDITEEILDAMFLREITLPILPQVKAHLGTEERAVPQASAAMQPRNATPPRLAGNAQRSGSQLAAH
jgi:Skp family chaperone for outer membrane proteins